MVHFRCIPITTDTAERFQSAGTDDYGNTVRRLQAGADGGYPCRHCLGFATPGQAMLLGCYTLPRPRGIYWTPSPIFVHAAPCARFGADDQVAPIIAQGGLVSVRAYDAADQCIYELGEVCAGPEVATPLDRALGDPRTAFVNVHTARPGCLLARVERVRQPHAA